MTQKTITRLIDDLDGSELKDGQGKTVQFGLDGQNYEIDLSNKNAERLRKALAKYVSAGRQIQRRRTTRQAETPVDNRAVRAWASANRIQVSARGRIPAAVVQRFRDAGN